MTKEDLKYREINISLEDALNLLAILNIKINKTSLTDPAHSRYISQLLNLKSKLSKQLSYSDISEATGDLYKEIYQKNLDELLEIFKK